MTPETWTLELLLAGALALGGCSNDEASGGTGAAGAGSGGTAGSGGSSAGAGGSSVGGSSTAGAGGTGECSDNANPMFDSCIEAFLEDCYAPDLTGTCSSAGGAVEWSDGSHYVTEGADMGLYGPGATEACITMTIQDAPLTITATRGSEVLVYSADQATEMGTITCPDGSTFSATFDQVSAHNRCFGLECVE